MRKVYELADEHLDQVLEGCGKAGKGVCGMDEAGRGALAGPVVAAAVILKSDAPADLADSKVVAPKRRERLFEQLQTTAYIGVGVVGVEVIDRINILEANFLAMQLALRQLVERAGRDELGSIIVDGNHLTRDLMRDCDALGATIFTLVKADAKVAAVSAASIIAKVTRDRIMTLLEPTHPGYGFAVNAGYGSPLHLSGLKQLGACAAHRRTFAPVAAVLRSGVAA